ncbi:hypothetical protein MMC17_006939 [Xylographa soralifera]|nr:hypothetical protein [Xylographa soralifera]
MGSSESVGKILIIGAGLGGLTLAQILWNHSVPFEIYERDETTFTRNQGWAVALLECLPALQELLPTSTAENLYTNSVNYHTGDCDEIAFVDSLTGVKVGAIGGIPRGQPGSMLRVSRKKLRTCLWESNSLPVSSGKHFTHYVEDKEGVTAFFKDGSSARGSLLIGADGIHSPVMDNLIGESDHKLVLSKYVPIFGEVVLLPALYQPLRTLGNAAILSGTSRVRQQIGMLSMAEDQSTASFFWALMPQREEPKELSDWVQRATKREIYEFAIETTKNLHPVMTDLIRFGGPDAITKPQPKFLEFVPPDIMPEGRVTVIGDAAHAMIPFRGAGANTAILDACDLARLLVKSWKEKRDPSGVLHSYHDLMIPRGKENVLSSRAAGEGEEDVATVWAKMSQRAR